MPVTIAVTTTVTVAMTTTAVALQVIAEQREKNAALYIQRGQLLHIPMVHEFNKASMGQQYDTLPAAICFEPQPSCTMTHCLQQYGLSCSPLALWHTACSDML